MFVRDDSITANTREHEIKKALRGSAGNCRHKNTDFAQTLSLLCARRAEKELDYDFDAAGASV